MFVIPLGIASSYHLFGWKVAVSLFPLLLFASWLARLRRGRQRRANRNPLYIKALFWSGICGIPLAAILASRPELMRLWALAAGLMLGMAAAGARAEMLPNSRKDGCAHQLIKVESFVRSAAPSVLLIIGSEIVWRFFGLGAWIWYHAFAVHIFLGIELLFFALTIQADRGTKDDPVIEYRPPMARSKRSGERHAVLIKDADGMWRRYNRITLGQARALFKSGAPDLTAAAIDHPHSSQPSGPWQFFKVEFGGTTSLGIALSDGTKNLVEWQHSGGKSRWPLKLPFRMTKARDMPLALVLELLDFGWEENWDALAAGLAPFAADA
jgi:hypothetical protein